MEYPENQIQFISRRAYSGCESVSCQCSGFLPAINKQNTAAYDPLVHTLFWREGFYFHCGES